MSPASRHRQKNRGCRAGRTDRIERLNTRGAGSQASPRPHSTPDSSHQGSGSCRQIAIADQPPSQGLDHIARTEYRVQLTVPVVVPMAIALAPTVIGTTTGTVS